MNTFTPKQIWSAQKRISCFIKATPLIYSSSLSSILESEVYLKPECFQVAGSFKVRGACNKVAILKQQNATQGLVTCSSGNHGTAQKYVRSSGALYVHSHSDEEVIAGQGTIGLELLAELPDLDTVVVPVGGGGLISGIATAVKAGSSEAEIFGVEAAAAPGAYLSFQDSRCHESVDINPSLADGLLGTLTPLTYSIASSLVSSIQIVEEAEIAAAIALLLETEQIIAEGSSVVGLAAALSGKLDLRGKKAVFVITGRNISKEKFLKALSSESLCR